MSKLVTSKLKPTHIEELHKDPDRLKKEMDKARIAYHNATDKFSVLVYAPLLMKAKGKCYKTRSGHRDGLQYPMYRCIVDTVADKDGYMRFIVEEFCINNYGNAVFNKEIEFPHHDDRIIFEGWTQITKKRYYAARAKFFEEIASSKNAISIIKKSL